MRRILVITYYSNGEPFRKVSMNRYRIKSRLRELKHRREKYKKILETSNGEFVSCKECEGRGTIKFPVLECAVCHGTGIVNWLERIKLNPNAGGVEIFRG